MEWVASAIGQYRRCSWITRSRLVNVMIDCLVASCPRSRTSLYIVVDVGFGCRNVSWFSAHLGAQNNAFTAYIYAMWQASGKFRHSLVISVTQSVLRHIRFNHVTCHTTITWYLVVCRKVQNPTQHGHYVALFARLCWTTIMKIITISF